MELALLLVLGLLALMGLECIPIIDKRGNKYYSDDEKDGYLTWKEDGIAVADTICFDTQYPVQIDKGGIIWESVLIIAFLIACLFFGETAMEQIKFLLKICKVVIGLCKESPIFGIPAVIFVVLAAKETFNYVFAPHKFRERRIKQVTITKAGNKHDD